MERYIAEHLVIRIGYDLPGHLCTDIIVDNPEEFIERIDTSQYFISGILWWEKTLKSERPKLGAGGPADPRPPYDYYFAETFLAERFQKEATKQDYCDYIQRIHSLYPSIHLCPSFDVAFRQITDVAIGDSF